MTLNRSYLLDVNVLVALSSDEHEFFERAHNWFDALKGAEWATCPLTETAYIRLAANPSTRMGAGSIERAAAVLAEIGRMPGHRFCQITEGWTALTAPFSSRISGHQQVTDAYLLGMAIKENAVLVTFDKGIRYLAGPQFAENVLVLQ